MAERDKEKIAFFTREGVFYYKILPFSLKNTGATYQKLIDEVFSYQLGRNMEVHADDMVIKSNSEEEMLTDIKETFERLRLINLKLNPRKCSFSVKEVIFLGHLITKQGIKANPSKVKAIPDLKPPNPVDEIQNLNTEKLHKWKNSLMDKRSRRSLLKNERVHRSTTNGNRPNQRRNLAETPSTRDKEREFEEAKRKEPEPDNVWKLFTDGASSSDGSGVGLMLVNPEGKEYTYALRFEFETTNNEAEYEAFYSIEHIRRDQNKKADALSKLASMTFSKPDKEVLVEVIQENSIAQREVADVVKEEENDWMLPI
ncbi:reverse transcriptase domain-containing protein [Tanacetum coccineum]